MNEQTTYELNPVLLGMQPRVTMQTHQSNSLMVVAGNQSQWGTVVGWLVSLWRI